MTTKQVVLAFDIYGTLLSPESICKEVEKYFNEKRSRQVAELWRRYQLEYSWRLTTMDCYSSFRDVTKNALVHALRELDSHLDTDDINQLLIAYNSIATFHDVEPTLERIAQMPHVKPVIFSNGTADMLSDSLARSSVLYRHRSVFKDVVSVDDIQKYKPAREVYEYLAQRVQKGPAELSDIWLVSGNPFDVIGARNVGLRAIWVDRAQKGWKDQAMPRLHPTAIVHQLEQVVDVINNHHVQQNAAT